MKLRSGRRDASTMAKPLEGLGAISIQEKLSADDLPGVRVSGGRNI